MGRTASRLRGMAIGALLAGPALDHWLMRAGQGENTALALAGLQAVGVGCALWPLAGRRAAVLAAVLLGVLGVGAIGSPMAGVLAEAGALHAMLYGGLLFLFARSLRPGRVALVTRLAQRLNPRFRAGMVPYTRAVTRLWCLFAALQLMLSAGLLLAGAIGPWRLLVGTLHGPMALALAGLEFLVRRLRFPGEHTSFRETIRGVRAATTGRR